MRKKSMIGIGLAFTLAVSAIGLTGCGNNSTASVKPHSGQIDVTTEDSTDSASGVTADAVDSTASSDSTQTNGTTTSDVSNAKSVTVLVYMNGSDLESEAGEATADITEMIQAGYSENVNVLIETIGTSSWSDTYGIAGDRTQIYKITENGLELVKDDLGQLDCTDPSSLSQFISWGAANYPADRYELIMWDHGGGAVYGFGYDENIGDEYATLTIDEMQTALSEAGVHFDFIGMDACIMSSIEVCSALSNYCDYTILSEDFESSLGWSYTNWLSALNENPAISTTELGTMIIDDMVSANENDEEEGSSAAMAMVDESKIDELFDAWTAFAYANTDTLLENNYSQEVSSEDDSRVLPVLKTEGSSDEEEDSDDSEDSWYEDDDESWYDDDSWYDEENWFDENNDWEYETYGESEDSSESEDESDGSDDEGYLWDELEDDGSYDDGSDWFSDDMSGDDWFGDWFDISLSDYYVTDILAAASNITSDESTALIAAVEDAIVYANTSSEDSSLTGLAVTLPYGDSEFYEELTEVFTNAGFDSEYITWLEQFTEAEGSSSFFDYSDWDENFDLDDIFSEFGLDDESSLSELFSESGLEDLFSDSDWDEEYYSEDSDSDYSDEDYDYSWEDDSDYSDSDDSSEDSEYSWEDIAEAFGL